MTLNELTIDGLELTDEKLHYIESILTTPIITKNIKTANIDPVKASRWYGNFYGLLHNELDISSNALYLHLRINGYRANTDYIGSTSITILEPSIFEEVEEAYVRYKAYRKSLGD